jgi:hypothetical protein
VGIVSISSEVAVQLAAEILRDPGTIYAAFSQCVETLHAQLDEATSSHSRVASYVGCNERLGILSRAIQLAAEHDGNVRAVEAIIDPMFRDVFANLLFAELGVIPTDEQLLFIGQGLRALNRDLLRFHESAALTMAVKTKTTSAAPVDRLPCVFDQHKVATLFGIVTTAESKLERVVDGERLKCIITNEDQWGLLTLVLKNDGRLSKLQVQAYLPGREGRSHAVDRLRKKLITIGITFGVSGPDYILSEIPR